MKVEDLVFKIRTDPPIEEVRRLLLRPGEVLVVKIDAASSHDTVEAIQAQFAALFPDNTVLVMPSNIDLSVIGPEEVAGEHSD